MSSALGPLQRILAWGLFLGGVTSVLGSTLPMPSAVAASRGACVSPGQSLGVSRIAEIDAATGPHFGHQQYKEVDFLAPGEIVLTFDDGPLRPHTQPILDALDAQCTRATFFMVGSQALGDPDMVRQVINRGHTVGNHTWSHANLRKSTPLKARQEIELGLSAVTAAAGQPVSPFFRFPYLADTKAMLGYSQTRGMGVFSIEVDSEDWKTKNAASVHREVLARLAESGKGIILFHDIQPATAQALPGLLEALRAKGYRVVHMKPKAMAVTLPEFDALARDTKGRNQAVASAQPLAKRSMTWGSASPTVISRAPTAAGAPGQITANNGFANNGKSSDAYRPAVTPYGAQVPARAATNPQWPVAQPGAQPATAPAASGAPGYGGPVGDPAGLPYPRIARQRPPASDDWRDKVFSR